MREWNGPPWGPKIRPVPGSHAIASGGIGTALVACDCGLNHFTWWMTTPPPSCKAVK